MSIIEGLFQRRDLLKNSNIAISWAHEEEAKRIGKGSLSVDGQARRMIDLSLRLFASQWGNFDATRPHPEYPNAFHDLVSVVAAHAFRSQWIWDSRRKKLNQELERQIQVMMELPKNLSLEMSLPALFPTGYIPRPRRHLPVNQQIHCLQEDIAKQQTKALSLFEYYQNQQRDPKMQKMATFLSLTATILDTYAKGSIAINIPI